MTKHDRLANQCFELKDGLQDNRTTSSQLASLQYSYSTVLSYIAWDM